MNTMEERERLRESLICSIKDYHFNNPEESRVEVTLEDSSPYVVDLKRIEDESYFNKAVEEMIDLKLGIKISPVKEEQPEPEKDDVISQRYNSMKQLELSEEDIALQFYEYLKQSVIKDNNLASSREKYKKNYSTYYIGYIHKKTTNIDYAYMDMRYSMFTRANKLIKAPFIWKIEKSLIEMGYITKQPSVYIRYDEEHHTGGVKKKISFYSLNK